MDAATQTSQPIDAMTPEHIFDQYAPKNRYWETGVQITMIDPAIASGVMLAGYVPRARGDVSLAKSNGRVVSLRREATPLPSVPRRYTWTAYRFALGDSFQPLPVRTVADFDGLLDWVRRVPECSRG